MPLPGRRFIAQQTPLDGAQETLPEPTFFEQVGAAFRVNADEEEIVQADRLASEYLAIADALAERGIPHDSLFSTSATPAAVSAYSMGAAPATVTTLDRDKIWRHIAAIRAREPGAFADLQKDRVEHDRFILNRRGAGQQDEALLARGGGVSGFTANVIGGGAASFADPVNIITLPIGGGGKTLAAKVLSETLVGMGVESLQIPGRIEARDRLGKETTAADVALDVFSAGVGAGAIRGGFEIAPAAVRAGGAGIDAGRARIEQVVANNWERLPAPLRDRWEARMRIAGEPAEDILLADMVEELGGDNLSELARDAIEVVRFEARTEAGNPFVPDGAGTAMHRDMIGAVFERVLSDAPLPPAGRFVAAVPDTGPVKRFTPDRDPVVSSTFGVDARAPVQGFMQRVRVQESGGRDNAKNPKSSATGRYQFIESTWLSYYKQRFGTGGLSDAQILAKRGDGRIQDILMRDLTEDNARFLRQRGEAVTEGNLYLVHFAGQGGATKVLAAAPDTPASRLFTADALKANPFLRDMTAEDVLRWAHRAMDQRLPPRGATPTFGDALARNAEEREAAQDALDSAITRAYTAAERQREAANGIGDVSDSLPEPVRVDSDDMLPVDVVARAANESDLPSELQVILPALDRIAGDRGRSLNRLDQIAEELGVTEAEVRGGLQELVRQERLTMDQRSGLFMRRPQVTLDPEQANALLPRVQQLVQETSVNLNDTAALARRLGVGDGDVQFALDRLVGQGELQRKRQWGVDSRGRRRRLPTGKYLRPRPKGGRAPDDLIGILASMGGVNPRGSRPPDGIEGDGLGRVRGGHDLRNTGSLNHFVPGVGPLLRPNGMYLDEVGEWLMSRGIFTERPTESEVIQFLDDAIGNGRDIDPETGVDRNLDPDLEYEAELDAMQREDAYRAVSDELRDLGFADDFDPDIIDELVQQVRFRPDNMTDSDALYYALNIMADRNQQEAFANNLEPVYEAIDYDDIIASGFPAGREAPPAEDDLAGFEPVSPLEEAGGFGRGRDGSDGGTARPEPDGRALADLTPEERAPFLDPDSAAIKQQSDSLEHDARAKAGPYGTLADEGEIEGGERLLSYVSQDGNRSDIILKIDEDGTAEISVDGLAASFADEAGRAPGANRFGPAVVRDALVQLRKLFPQIRRIKGDRLTGAGAGRVQVIEVDAAPTITTDATGQADFAAPTQDQARTALERQGEGRLQTDVAQRAPGSDGGLFDTRDTTGDIFDAPRVRLDPDGEDRSLREVIEEFDREAQELKNIRDCL